MKQKKLCFVFLFVLCWSNIDSIAQHQYHSQTELPECLTQATIYKPDNTIHNLGIVLNSIKGSILYIDFWASWCTPCREEMVYSKKLQQYYANKAVIFQYHSTDEIHNDWIKAIPEKQGSKSMYFRLDVSSKPAIRNYFKIRGIPHYMLINHRGSIARSNAHWPSTNRIHKVIDNLLDEIKSMQ